MDQRASTFVRARRQSGRIRPATGLLVLLLAGWPAALAAQQPQQTDVPQQQEKTRYGVGFQSAFPAYGVSAMMDVGDHIAVQGVLGAFGTVSTFAGRGIYRFQHNRTYNLYGFGTAGVWRWSSGPFSESSLGIGGGAGLELDWRNIFAGNGTPFPPLMSSLDIGLTFANFDSYSFNALTLGAGFHYRF
jgi:hypothetical protein